VTGAGRPYPLTALRNLLSPHGLRLSTSIPPATRPDPLSSPSARRAASSRTTTGSSWSVRLPARRLRLRHLHGQRLPRRRRSRQAPRGRWPTPAGRPCRMIRW